MIGKYKNFVLTTFWIYSLCFEYINNGQKLTIVSFVLGFGWYFFF